MYFEHILNISVDTCTLKVKEEQWWEDFRNIFGHTLLPTITKLTSNDSGWWHRIVICAQVATIWACFVFVYLQPATGIAQLGPPARQECFSSASDYAGNTAFLIHPNTHTHTDRQKPLAFHSLLRPWLTFSNASAYMFLCWFSPNRICRRSGIH